MVQYRSVDAALRKGGPLEFVTEQEEDFAKAIREAYKEFTGKRHRIVIKLAKYIIYKL